MERSWVLTDAASGLWVETLELGPEQLGIPGCAVRKRRLRGGLRDGVDLIEVTCGELSFSVVPTRGMGVWRGSYGGQALGWRSPVRGPVHPAFINPLERGGVGWLRGFDEWIVRCGLDSNGMPGRDMRVDAGGLAEAVDLTLHGMIANLPAHTVQVTADAAARVITVTGQVDEAGLFLPSLRLSTSISAGPDSSRITIADTVRNLQDTPAELQLLYHCNYGPPFLEAGSRVLLPFSEAAPRDARSAEGVAEIDRYHGPAPGFVQQAYWIRPAARPGDTATLAALVNASRTAAAVMRFDIGELPCFSLWKNTAGERDGYVTGLEPGTNFPNLKSVERDAGRVVELPAGGDYAATLMLEVASGEEAVAAVESEVREIQAGAAPTVHAEPQAAFGAVGDE